MRTRKPERTNEKKKRITLLGVIANGSTSEARKLLKKYDQPDATNHEDLEYKALDRLTELLSILNQIDRKDNDVKIA